MKKKTTQRLPPDEDSLRWHIMRCNYVIFMNMNYKSSNAIEPPRYNSWKDLNRECSSIRYEKPALSESMSISTYTETHGNGDEERIIDVEKEDDIIKGSDDEESANDTDEEDTIYEYND